MRGRGEIAPAVAYGLLAVAALCWAGNFILGRAVHAEIPPVGLAFWRWAVACAVLAPFTAGVAWRYRAVLVRHWRLVGVLAVLGVAVFHVCIYRALHTTTAINVALIQATVPLLIPIVGFALDREPVGSRQGAGIVLSLAGAATIVLRGDLAALAAFDFAPGDLWALAAAAAWSVYTALLRRAPRDLPPLALILAIAALGSAVLAPLYLWERAVLGGFAVTVDTVLAIAYVALFASVVAYICWNRGVGAVGPTKAGLFVHLMPVFTAALALAFLGERLHGFHLAGVALIAAGIVLTTTARGRSRS